MDNNSNGEEEEVIGTKFHCVDCRQELHFPGEIVLNSGTLRELDLAEEVVHPVGHHHGPGEVDGQSSDSHRRGVAPEHDFKAKGRSELNHELPAYSLFNHVPVN